MFLIAFFFILGCLYVLTVLLALARFFTRNELAFYSPSGHHAAFALPPVALRELAKPPPSLRATTADLEEIMAYGEESEQRETTSGSFSQKWEPDVSAEVLSYSKRRVSWVVPGMPYRAEKSHSRDIVFLIILFLPFWCAPLALSPIRAISPIPVGESN